jgi:hypothetical protein
MEIYSSAKKTISVIAKIKIGNIHGRKLRQNITVRIERKESE